ncbi:toprim domain-containing protein [Thioalkalivibrio sp. ALE16]|uniref:DUF7146 domain-containing protein n=1 Tax=Thioalkalivibrio sp. ALE16 TaxID=1158172 RepID=UPI00039B85EF|nr:toprim domain-containing protein [Thioalkalivibrio sp. ALE16]
MSQKEGKPKRLKAWQIKEMAEGKWDVVFSALARENLEAAMRRAPNHVANPILGGTDGFRLDKNWVETGRAYVNRPGESGALDFTSGDGKSCFTDGLAVLRWLRKDLTFPQLLDAIANVLGGNFDDLPDAKSDPVMLEQQRKRKERQAQERQKRDEETAEQLNRLSRESFPLDSPEGIIGRTYLENRGIRLQQWPETVRVHPKLGWYDYSEKKTTKSFPGLLALLCQEDGAKGTLHRTFLSEDGTGKAPVPVGEEKRLCRVQSTVEITGGAIPLFPFPREGAGILHLAEGLESALSVRYGLKEQEPVWATFSAALLRGFQPPPHTRKVVIWADLDRSIEGEHASAHLARRLIDRGIEVKVLFARQDVPEGEKGYDWNDALRDYGPEYIWNARRYV